MIEQERPDCVCVELDAQRFEALSQKSKFQELDIRQVIRKKQLAALLANLLLASYQKKLGGALGIVPGTELLEATRVAEEHGGTLTMPAFKIETVGTLIKFQDTEGNSVGAMQYEPGVRG